MLIVSDEYVERDLNDRRNLSALRDSFREDESNNENESNGAAPPAPDVVGKVVPMPHGGRKNGDKNLGEENQAFIGALANLDSATNIAKNFKVSAVHARNLANGIVSRPEGVRPKLAEKINDKLEPVRESATEKLIGALGLVTIHEIETAPKRTKQIVDIAEKLGKIAMIGKGVGVSINGNNAKVLIYSPGQRDMGDYEQMEVETRLGD